MLRRHVLAGGTAAVLLAPAAARAWPDRPVRAIMPFAPGGNGDLTLRIVAAALSERIGQPVVVENRAGAGGSIGTAEAARARPDGHTILGSTAGALIVNPLVQASPGYDPMRDFAHVGLVSRVPMVMIVANAIPARTLPELIALSRAQPGRLGIGTSGTAGANHLPLEVLNADTGAGLLHVPYRGGGAALPDLVSGTLAGALTEMSGVLDLHRTGRARIIAVAAPVRSVLLPDVPTFIEAGLPGFTAEAFIGLSVPAATPEPVVARIGEALADIFVPAVEERLRALGAEIATPEQRTPAGMRAYMEAEIAKARRGVAVAGLKPE